MHDSHPAADWSDAVAEEEAAEQLRDNATRGGGESFRGFNSGGRGMQNRQQRMHRYTLKLML